jgi:Secretion system C-terminal sorting domain
MKKLILSYFFGVSLVFPLMAQEQQPSNFCGTAPGKTEWLKQYQSNPEQFEKYRGSATLYMPMTVTIVTNDNGTNGYSFHAVLDEICQLNKDYQASNIHFFLASPIRTIKNSKWNNHKTYEDGYDLYENNVPNTINTYYCTDAAGNCGYDIPGMGMILAKNCMGPTSHTWAHEMGHELSLPHTFVGWEGVGYNSNKPTPDTVQGHPVEKVNGSNCKDAGDGFCDTPPDYISYRWTCGANGKSSTELKDPNGVVFRADGTNFLSYSNDICMNRFSPEQMAAMRSNSLTEKKEYGVATLADAAIQDTVSLVSPALDAIVSTDSVTLQWTKVPNATHYYYEIARDKKMSLNPIRGDIGSTSVTLSVPKGRLYYWRVRAYNLSYPCAIAGAVKYKSFSTEDAASNVLDVNGLENISIYPNPVKSDGILKIKINAKHTGMISLSLNDVTGRQIAQQRVALTDGENELDFPVGSLSSGLYLLQLAAPVGSVQRKITVF